MVACVGYYFELNKCVLEKSCNLKIFLKHIPKVYINYGFNLNYIPLTQVSSWLRYFSSP